MSRAAARIALTLSGQDKTAAAFGSVQQRAKAAMGGMKRTLAMAGAGLGIAGIAVAAKRGVRELSLLSDQAQRMGTSAVYAQQLVGALDQVGIVGANIDSVAKAFQRMSMMTGAEGADGFRETMASVSELATEQERLTELTRIFGREMGGKFAPLVRQGPEALREGLESVMAMMPAVSDEAANAGDGVSDALNAAAGAAKAAWLESVGGIVTAFQEGFGVSLEEAIHRMVAWVRWGAGTAWAHFKAFGENIGKVAAFFVEDWKGALKWIGAGFAGVLNAIGRLAREFGRQLWSWLKGDGMDWSAVWNEAIAGFEEIKSGHADRIQWSFVDKEALAEARDAAIDTAKAGIAAKALLATGVAAAEGDIGAAGRDAAQKVRDAAGHAGLIYAGSYAAVQARLRGSTAAGAQGMRSGESEGKRAADAAEGTSKNTSEMLSTLRRLLTATEENTRRMAALGVI